MQPEITVNKTPDSKWVAQIKIGTYQNGRAKVKSFFGDKRRVVLERAENFLKNQNCSYECEKKINTIESVIKEYLFSHKIHTVKQSTFDDYYYCGKIISDYLKNYDIGSLTARNLQYDLIFKMKTDKYSFSVIKKTTLLVKAVFKFAYDNKIIAENIAQNLELPSKKLFTTKQIKFMDDYEIELFKQEALKEEYSNGALLVALIYTGLRGGELCALKKEDIDFGLSCIYVNKNSRRINNYTNGEKQTGKHPVILNSTKTSDGRVVKLSKSAIKYLNLHFDRHSEIKDKNYVVTSVRAKLPSISALEKQYDRILAQIGLEKMSGLHTLRHTCASLMIRKGIDIKVVSEVLGHADTAFTYRTYVHVVDKQKQEAMEALDF